MLGRCAYVGTRLVVGLCLFLTARTAAAFDPATDWQTLSSPYVRVHYPAGRYEQALAVARAAKGALVAVTLRLGSTPELPIDIVLDDETDAANGSARSYPYNLVTLNLVAPEDVSELASYDDWVFGLVSHELTHVVHLDTVGGVASVINTIFGRWYFPNSVQPRWVIEGMATYFESALSHGGRVRSSYYDMLLRSAVLEETPMQLDEFTGSPHRWPQGVVAYLYGSYFLDYVARHYGEEALTKVSLDYGSRFVPFAVNLSAARATGRTYPTLYEGFQAELWARFANQVAAVERRGRREGVSFTSRGQYTGPARAATDGSIYYVQSPLDDHTTLRVARPDGSEREVMRVGSDAALTLLPDGRHALMSQIEYDGAYRRYSDMFVVDLEEGGLERLTHGLRGHSPDVSADGTLVTFVQNDGFHSVLRLARLAPTGASGKATKPAGPAFQDSELLVDFGPAGQVWSPRLSPNGREVAFVGFTGGRRDLYVVEIATRALRRLTNDKAIEGGPTFTPDGRFVLFHCDRDGIFDLYALPAQGDGPRRRVTRVFGGALRPEVTRDGKAVIYESYSAHGFDLARLDLGDGIESFPVEPPEEPQAPAATVTQGAGPQGRSLLDVDIDIDIDIDHDRIAADDTLARAPSRAAIAADTPRGAEPVPSLQTTPDAYRASSYSPWPSLRPRAWMPVVAYDGERLSLGAAFGGQDAVGEHTYSVEVDYLPTDNFASFGIQYVNNQFFPGASVGLSRYLGSAPVAYVRNDHGYVVEEDVWSADLGTVWPLWQSRSSAAQLSLLTNYSVDWREPLTRMRFGPMDTTPQYPDEGRFNAVNLALGFSNVESYGNSISAERGLAATARLRLEDPYLGSQYSALSGSLDASLYVNNPLLSRHVLATTIFFGYGKSSYKRRKLFAIGGVVTGDVLLDTLLGRVAAPMALRGFPPSAFAGDAAVIGSCEYRFPIFDLDRGLSTLPFFVRTLHAAAFVDGAALADEPSGFGAAAHYSAGGELRLGTLLGYYLPVTFRVGYGHALGEDAQSFYVILGNTY